ncbi:threonine ammonia-lyase [Bdellovibrio sp. HCB337]|uniref:threonine ammonia-lyase n=1 Tax=Bdellovibrio sp. HCB337 TaxID=3394358 RepID=UPI0039A49142
MKVTIEEIRKARETLKNISKTTEVDHSISASRLLGSDVYLKFENTQRTGSFKIRGAYNKIINLTNEEKKRGVVASSAGNHAQGVALSAALAGVKATIVMPENAPLTKVNATRGYGAEVILKGEIYDDAYEHARHLEKTEGYVFVHPYEDAHIIAGQGTIGLELHEQIPDLDTVIIPIGGGGLISGISTALKTLNPKIKIIGVQSDQAPGMSQLFHKQSPEPRKRISTIADGIAIKHPSQIVYDSFIAKNVDEVVTVTDDELAEAIVFLLERAKTMTEGSGAAAMAAAMNRKLKLGKKTCIILSGGNVDLNVISKIIEKGQTKRGRLAELSVVVDDLPGNLNRLTKAIAEQKANILEVHHDRISQGLFLRETRIEFVLETSSPEHIEKIKQALIAAGGKIL